MRAGATGLICLAESRVRRVRRVEEFDFRRKLADEAEDSGRNLGVRTCFIDARYRYRERPGGPPFRTHDPGTPGSNNRKINAAAAPTISREASNDQVPQIDLNCGLGACVQLTYEAPFVFQSTNSLPTQSGWANGYPGVKWRFLDLEEGGWQISTLPPVELGGARGAREGHRGCGAAVSAAPADQQELRRVRTSRTAATCPRTG